MPALAQIKFLRTDGVKLTCSDQPGAGGFTLEVGPPVVPTPLDALTIDSAFAHAHVVDQDMAQCCFAAVWLLHDELDQSHRISQDVDTPTGSFWHGIMHRREGDFSNSKYWFARIGRHIYGFTQLKIHVIVTHAFLRSLARLDLAESRVGSLAERPDQSTRAPMS